jgi:hypothetical protein
MLFIVERMIVMVWLFVNGWDAAHSLHFKIDYVVDAIEFSRGDNVRMARLIGNLGRIEILNGDWSSAESNLKTALQLASDLGQKISAARNHLSLGYLYLRQRQFILAGREFRRLLIIKMIFAGAGYSGEYEGGWH